MLHDRKIKKIMIINIRMLLLLFYVQQSIFGLHITIAFIRRRRRRVHIFIYDDEYTTNALK